MSEREIIVPEGMVEAVYEGHLTLAPGTRFNDSQKAALIDAFRNYVTWGLRWLSEHPRYPSKEQGLQLLDLCKSTGMRYGEIEPTIAGCIAVAVQWQKEMFLKPEEFPEELKIYQWGDWQEKRIGKSQLGWDAIRSHNAQVMAAFELGKKTAKRDGDG